MIFQILVEVYWFITSKGVLAFKAKMQFKECNKIVNICPRALKLGVCAYECFNINFVRELYNSVFEQ